MTSVGSDLTERIRESLRQRYHTGIEDEESETQVDTGELSLIGSQADENIQLLGGPIRGDKFEERFTAKGMNHRAAKILANIQASHLREEFKRTLSHGPSLTRDEVQSERLAQK